MTSDQPVYLDHAATTPVAPEVLSAMLPYFGEKFANPASIYALASEARAAVENAREIIAESVGVQPDEVFFTSGGTESNNWVIKGTAASTLAKSQPESPHILTTQIEHSSLLGPCEGLLARGCDVEFLPVDSEGFVDPEEVRGRIRPNTALVSVMLANNEVGSVQDIARIGEICRERNVPLHTDAVQALGKLPIDARELNVDLISLSAHKVYGPKGIGALIIRRGVKLRSFMEGGEQEKGRRAGTLNVPGIVGFGEAVRVAESGREQETRRITELRDRLINGIKSTVHGARLSGPSIASGNNEPIRRLPNNAHFCFEGIEGESLLLALDMAGICASAGSACSAGSTEPSHVLLAMGYSVERARGALRLTLGRSTTREDVDRVTQTLAAAVKDLKALSVTAEMI